MIIDESWYKRPPATPERISAGGVVARLKDGHIYIALVKEVGLPSFVLPKGGVEAGETLEVAARREIEEEAGLTALTLVEKLGVCKRLTYEKAWWNITHYFLFQTEQSQGVPTDHAHHYGTAWFPVDGLPSIFWPEQRKIIEANRERIIQLISHCTTHTNKPVLQ